MLYILLVLHIMHALATRTRHFFFIRRKGLVKQWFHFRNLDTGIPWLGLSTRPCSQRHPGRCCWAGLNSLHQAVSQSWRVLDPWAGDHMQVFHDFACLIRVDWIICNMGKLLFIWYNTIDLPYVGCILRPVTVASDAWQVFQKNIIQQWWLVVCIRIRPST